MPVIQYSPRILHTIISASVVIACLFPTPVCSSQPASQAPPSVQSQADSSSLFSRIVPNDCIAPSVSDLTELKLAVARFRSKSDQQDEVRALVLLGTLYEQSGEYKLALPYLEAALLLVRDNGTRVQVLTMTADALTQVGSQLNDAMRDARDALAISRKLGDLGAQASALRAEGEVAFAIGPHEKAMPFLQEAMPLSRKAGDAKTEAMILNDEAAVEQDAGSPFDTFRQALSLEEGIHDCRDTIDTLTNLATLEFERGQIQHALEHIDEAATLEHKVNDHTAEADTLHQMAYFHWELGDLAEALSLFNQALQLKQRTGDLASGAETAAAIAGVYRDAQWPSAALEAYRKVLPLIKDKEWQAMIVNNLGMVEADLHHPKDARDYYERATWLARGAGDPVTAAYAAWGIGELEQQDALSSYFQSVRMAREYEQADLEGEVDSSLMDHFHAHHQPNVAIFFGKRAVDRFQSLRRSMGTMSNALTSSFLQKKSATYRTLAELLIDQGRLIEAQQVLDLLKIQQYSDYLGEQPSELSQPLTRSPREAPLEAELDEKLDRLVALDKALVAVENAKAAQTAAIFQARTAFRTAQSGFNAFLESLYRQLNAQAGPSAAVQNVSGAELPLERVIARDERTVALYTLEGEDAYHVIAISHAGRFARSYPIAQSKLDEKCQAFLELLKKRDAASTAAAQALFGIVFEPLQKDLEAMGAKTLVWYLDGSLRYIPIAALLDPQTHRYLLDSYTIVNFTPLVHSLDDSPDLKGAQAIAMGISKKYVNDLVALPNVKDELDSVVSDPTIRDSHGALRGKVLIDGQFTEKAMEESLKSQTVVHIASHFVLKAGSDDLSYLLLAGKDQDQAGYRYSMAEFKKSQGLHLEGTKLFTLSACETGASNERDVCFERNQSSVMTAVCQAGKANQRENGVVMEGMSEVVLGKGAEAVISSLWNVDDRSTSILMADFYRRWADPAGKLTKATALREAELDLLHGRFAPQTGGGGRGVRAEGDESGAADFAHPYYWAPFVLTGNWQ